MKIDMSGGKIKLDKELNDLDELVLDFVKLLDKNRINYVLVSGYVAILFGRSRSSEDVDIIIQEIPAAKFLPLWQDLLTDFDCLVSENPVRAYIDYLASNASLRFSRKKRFVPNIEIKFPAVREIDNWVLENSKRVILNGKTIKISPVELQIPYKLYLSTQKDIEDARHLYKLFKERLDMAVLKDFLKKLDKEDEFNKYLA